MTETERNFYREIGKLLQKYRLAKGWSQEQMRRKANLTRNAVFCYEAGRSPLSLQRFVQLCQLLDLDFRVNSPIITPTEQAWLKAYHQHNYALVLDWLRSEITGEKQIS